MLIDGPYPLAASATSLVADSRQEMQRSRHQHTIYIYIYICQHENVSLAT